MDLLSAEEVGRTQGAAAAVGCSAEQMFEVFRTEPLRFQNLVDLFLVFFVPKDVCFFGFRTFVPKPKNCPGLLEANFRWLRAPGGGISAEPGGEVQQPCAVFDGHEVKQQRRSHGQCEDHVEQSDHHVGNRVQ